jgi:hypothetical protein
MANGPCTGVLPRMICSSMSQVDAAIGRTIASPSL